MAEFNIRSDAVDVEQIMRQIRARIREKRGVDYTEQQIQELATVKLERFLDPKGIRSDLVEQFRLTRSGQVELFEPPKYSFEGETLYETHRGLLRFVRRLLNPILKLFFNPNPLIHALHRQADINALYAAQFNEQQFKKVERDKLDALYYELIHNLVLELTRLGIETKNLKMRLESIASRLDFDERRARALEGVVQYKPGTVTEREPSAPRPQPKATPREQPAARPQPAAAAPVAEPEGGGAPPQDGSGRPRRRRRRRGRRGGRPQGAAENAGGDMPGMATPAVPSESASAETESLPSSADDSEDGPDASDL